MRAASAYPVEIDVADAVAVGEAITDVTSDRLARKNVAHALENAAVTNRFALALLRRNSHTSRPRAPTARLNAGYSH